MNRLQVNWDIRAALNFMLGGSGAGLMAASALVEPPSPWPLACAAALVAIIVMRVTGQMMGAICGAVLTAALLRGMWS